MIMSFDPDLAKRRIEITGYNCEKILGHPKEEVIALAGIYGLESNHDRIRIEKFSGIYPKLAMTIKVRRKGIVLRRHLRLDLGTIYNAYFMINRSFRQKGNGLRMLEAQIKAATEAGFKQIHCEAHGGRNDRLRRVGHIVWAKLGFLPTPYSSLDIAEDLQEHRTETTLSQLLSTEDGCAYWRDFGITWDGIFDLSPGSESHSILNRYKVLKS